MDHYLHHDLGMLPLLRCIFAHLLILQYLDHHQNLISSSLYYSGPVHKISSQSVHNFLSNVVHRQTNKQTNRQTNATKNITSFAKEVKNTELWELCETSGGWFCESVPRTVTFSVLQTEKLVADPFKKVLCTKPHCEPLLEAKGLSLPPWQSRLCFW